MLRFVCFVLFFIELLSISMYFLETNLLRFTIHLFALFLHFKFHILYHAAVIMPYCSNMGWGSAQRTVRVHGWVVSPEQCRYSLGIEIWFLTLASGPLSYSFASQPPSNKQFCSATHFCHDVSILEKVG